MKTYTPPTVFPPNQKIVWDNCSERAFRAMCDSRDAVNAAKIKFGLLKKRMRKFLK